LTDRLGAFCAHLDIHRDGRRGGVLSGLRFAIKDVFAVAGERACFGNPTWLATHPPATGTAAAVEQLIEAGATLVGATITDELAFSLTGENAHYGTPINPACPDRVPGGSSSGSAVAVAGGLVDFALGTDTGGSVRVPASHCGVYGFRPTHGAVDIAGVLPFAPRFDTVGWFARTPHTLAAVGGVLLPPDVLRPEPLARARLLEDAFSLLTVEPCQVRARALQMVRELFLVAEVAPVGGLTSWLPTYLTLQNAEVARIHRNWITTCQPTFGSLIDGRMTRALAVTAGEEAAAEDRREEVCTRIASLLEGGRVLVLPTACAGPLPRGSGAEVIDADTGRSLTLCAVAGLAGLPQVTLPRCRPGGVPLGLSLIAAPGRDRALLALACRLFPAGELPVTSGC
jgi:amidase